MGSTTVQSSWADEIEEGDSNTLPLATETISGNKKITTEYSINDDGKKIKIVRTFERVHKKVPKTVAQRKVLPKFGMSRNDNPGPNPATTVVAEEIYMNFVHNKENMRKMMRNRSGICSRRPTKASSGVDYVKRTIGQPTVLTRIKLVLSKKWRRRKTTRVHLQVLLELRE